jgi:hypothetical protein
LSQFLPHFWSCLARLIHSVKIDVITYMKIKS